MSTPLTKLEFLKKWGQALAPYNLGYKLKLASQLMYRDFLERLEPYGMVLRHSITLCCAAFGKKMVCLHLELPRN